MSSYRHLGIIVFGLLITLAFCGAATAETLYANESGWYRAGGAFNTSATPIQHAVDNASSGDIVYVWNGSYSENIDISTDYLTVEGEGRDVVTVTAAASTKSVIEILANYVNISGVSVTGATSGGCAGILVSPSKNHLTISNVNSSNNGFGMSFVFVSTDITITNNIINLNSEDGIHLHQPTRVTITNNIINLNNHTGINIQQSTHTTIENNTANSNNRYGIYLSELLSDGNISNNTASSNNYGGIHLIDSSDTTLTNNTASSNVRDGILIKQSNDLTLTNNTASSNGLAGIKLDQSNDLTLTNNTAISANNGLLLSHSTNNVIIGHNSTNNTEYDYFAWDHSQNNTLLNCDLSGATSMINDSTSQWTIRYTDGRILDTDDPALQMICNADNCTLTVEPNTNDYSLNMTTLDVTVSAATGSVTVAANSTLIGIDYINSTINDLNITSLDRQLILESAGVQTMVFDPTNVFNIWNMEYYVNATANRKAVSFNTYTTNATNPLNFTFYALYPSSTFDCKYNSTSFTTNTSGVSGTLRFNKSTWTANIAQLVEIYMTTTPYSCEGGLCTTTAGSPITLYLDLNDTTVTHVRAQITKPNAATTNHSMTDFVDNGVTSWYLTYTDTGVTGTYQLSNFYSSKDGSTWKQLDSFLSFSSQSPSGGGGGALPTPTPTQTPHNGYIDQETEPDSEGVTPSKRCTSELISGTATFSGCIITKVSSDQSGTVRIGAYKINPTTTSLIGGIRYGYADIQVPDRNIGGTVCFVKPAGAAVIYHLEDNEWVELKTRSEGVAVCADVGHFSYFALAEPGMDSVIESMTQLTLSPPQVSGILVWKWLSDEYRSTHTANRELANVSTSEGITCEILTTGDYPNRTLKCTYTPPKGANWTSLKYAGEVIAIDAQGYTKRIPVKINVYDMDKLGFPVLTGVILIGGVLLYRKYD